MGNNRCHGSKHMQSLSFMFSRCLLSKDKKECREKQPASSYWLRGRSMAFDMSMSARALGSEVFFSFYSFRLWKYPLFLASNDTENRNRLLIFDSQWGPNIHQHKDIHIGQGWKKVVSKKKRIGNRDSGPPNSLDD